MLQSQCLSSPNRFHAALGVSGSDKKTELTITAHFVPYIDKIVVTLLI